MSTKMLATVAVALSGLALVSCERLPSQQKPAATLSLQSLPSTTAIPAEYGDLVAVTSDPKMPHSVQLWFQKPDKSVVLVFADFRNRYIAPQSLVIPRQ